MGSLAPEIGRDLKLFTKRIIGCFMKDEIPRGGASSLKELVCRLQEEQRKIDAFKRELPLCMILVNDAIDELKLEVEQCRNDGLVLEEFMTLKTRSYENGDEERRELKMEKESRDKMEWMSSAQLWNDNGSDGSVDCEKDSQEKRDGEALSLESRSRYAGVGAFLPFKVIPAASRKEEEKLMSLSLPDLSLLVPESKSDAGNNHLIGPVSKIAASAQAPPPPPSPREASARMDLQGQRKSRRCWSPELHRRFISALHQLGGAQAATPKLIRELMSVDGLTNDEVKSHLQKYRLHTRRIPNSSATRTNRPLGMDDGLWNSQDHCSDSHHSASELLQEPLRLACTAQALSTTAGESCGEDNGKSESHSWN